MDAASLGTGIMIGLLLGHMATMKGQSLAVRHSKREAAARRLAAFEATTDRRTLAERHDEEMILYVDLYGIDSGEVAVLREVHVMEARAHGVAGVR